jgi:serine/threonine-protein kinase HipA
MAANPKQVRRAEVYKAGRAAAVLSRTDSGVQFEYLSEYDGPPAAHSLPLGQVVATSGGAVPAFFSGLLPEGRRLSALQRSVKASADDELSLLLAVGADVVGDVAVLTEGTSPTQPTPTVSGSAELAKVSFADLMTDAGFVDRVGMAGAQDKLSAGRITLPARLGTGEAIIKLNPPDYPGAVENEHYFLGLARRLNLPVASAELVHDKDGLPGLVVARFDRATGPNGDPVRLAVEDACQLLNRYPADKYSVTSEEVTAAVSSACAASMVAARAVFQQFSFAWLTGNGDLHAKNVSVLAEPSGEWRVAPIYDVPSTLAYGDKTMALRLQAADANLSRKRFLAFAAAMGLPAAAAQRALDEVLTATEPMLDELRAGAVTWNPKLRQDVVRQLTARRRLVNSPA